MNRIKLIAFTHKNIDLKEIGRFHLDESVAAERLQVLRNLPGIEELMYVTTCNRVEFMLVTRDEINETWLTHFFTAFNPEWNTTDIAWATSYAAVFEGDTALRHILHVASSLDSLVVGEREIITQVRNSYERCAKYGITGDLIRLIVKKAIETAKEVYTETQIADKPVSVVSLAYRRLRDLNVMLDARILIIGAGVTNNSMAKYLRKHGFTNFTVFNRSLVNAQTLATELNAPAYPLAELGNYSKGFDVILTCTGAAEPVITKNIYEKLTAGDSSRKIVIDLAVPNDLDPEILDSYDINLIAVNNLQEVAKENLLEREKELDACHDIVARNIEQFNSILHERKVELAMSEVPRKVKEIRETAMNTVFAKDIATLDQSSKDVLEKVIAYMEKKYISVPMKMAKEILIDEQPKA
ncbi:MAG: glutamyl-tRNA reductase [Bacteroidia bacterium]